MNPPVPDPGSKPTERPGDRSADAALHALSALPPAEAHALEEQLDGDPELEAEVEAFRAAAAELGLLAPPVDPPTSLRQRVLARAQARAQAQPARGPATPFGGAVQEGHRAGEAPSFLAREDGPFVPLGVPGVAARTLHRDDAEGFATVLVRMEPGATYPPHRHGGHEECYVLEGDLEIGAVTMHAGDFQISRRGTVHPLQTTRGGCLLLIRSSLHDELVEAD